jgi:oligopeptide transport system substrate-binding protein
MVRAGTGGYTTPDAVRFDPGEARRLLAEAGYPGGAGLPPIDFTLNSNAGATLLIGAALQEMWAKNLGVQVAVQPVEFKAYLTLSREKQFQLLLDGWGLGVADPRDMLLTGTTGDPNNDSGWSNRDYDAAFMASELTGVAAQRQASFDAMEKLLAGEAPYAPLYYSNLLFLLHPSVHGWRTNPLHIIDWRELWLEAPK